MIKLGPHFMPGDSAEIYEYYKLAPASVKFAGIDLEWAKYQDNKTLINSAPAKSLIVAKLAEPVFSFESGDPIERAVEYAQHFFPVMDELPRVDVWEGLNEVGIMPEETARMVKYSDFCAEFARQIRAHGKAAGIGAWATGNPPSLDQWQYFRGALEACQEYGAYLTRHNYGPLDEYLGLRHRADRRTFDLMGLGEISMLITECGADFCSIPGWAAWRKMGWTIEQYYTRWVKPFILQINKDPYVKGAHIFTWNGSGAWSDYDVAHSGLLELVQNDIEELKVEDDMPDVSVIAIYNVNITEPLPSLDKVTSIAKAYSGQDALFIYYSNALGVTTDRKFSATCQKGTPVFDAPYGKQIRTETSSHSVSAIHCAGEWCKVYDAPPMWVEIKYLFDFR